MDAVIQSGAAAVVFKGWDEVAALSREPASRRVALLSVPEEMTWTQLHAFLVNASRFSESSAAGGIAGVPLGDLFALSNAIAGAVGGAVTIEDPSRRVLAYSTIGEQEIDAARRGSILGRQVPDSPGIRTLYRMVFATDGRDDGGRAAAPRVSRRRPVRRPRLQAALGDRDPRREPGDRLDLDRARRERTRRRLRAVASSRRRGSRPRTSSRRAPPATWSDGCEARCCSLCSTAAATRRRRRRVSDSSRQSRSRVLGFELAGGETAVDELNENVSSTSSMIHCEASCRQTAAVGDRTNRVRVAPGRARAGTGADRTRSSDGSRRTQSHGSARRSSPRSARRPRARATCRERGAKAERSWRYCGGDRKGRTGRRDRRCPRRGRPARAARARAGPAEPHARAARARPRPRCGRTGLRTRRRYAPISTRSATSAPQRPRFRPSEHVPLPDAAARRAVRARPREPRGAARARAPAPPARAGGRWTPPQDGQSRRRS